MADATLEWIENTDKQLRTNQANLEQRRRFVWAEWLKLHKESATWEEKQEASYRISTWFETRTEIRKQYFGWLYVGSFYYATLFWPIFIPVVFGEVTIKIFEALRTMSEDVFQSLASNKCSGPQKLDT